MENPPAENELWAKYSHSRDEDTRNQLVLRYFPLVKYAAQRVHSRLHGELELEDLHSSGIFGLIDAVERFEPSRGYRFETFATRRVRGAMIDDLRRFDWVSRLARSRAGAYHKAREVLLVETGLVPTEEEIRQRLDISKRRFTKVMKDCRPAGQISISYSGKSEDEEGNVTEDSLPERREIPPYSAAEKKDTRDFLTRGFSERDKKIFGLYFYEGHPMSEIGEIIGVSESRVSQLLKQILDQMRNRAFGRLLPLK